MALDRFRDALRRRDRVNHLSQKLALVRVEHLLVKFGVLERNEADEIKDSSKSGEERIRRIIEKLLTKVRIHKHCGVCSRLSLCFCE